MKRIQIPLFYAALIVFPLVANAGTDRPVGPQAIDQKVELLNLVARYPVFSDEPLINGFADDLRKLQLPEAEWIADRLVEGKIEIRYGPPLMNRVGMVPVAQYFWGSTTLLGRGIFILGDPAFSRGKAKLIETLLHEGVHMIDEVLAVQAGKAIWSFDSEVHAYTAMRVSRMLIEARKNITTWNNVKGHLEEFIRHAEGAVRADVEVEVRAKYPNIQMNRRSIKRMIEAVYIPAFKRSLFEKEVKSFRGADVVPLPMTTWERAVPAEVQEVSVFALSRPLRDATAQTNLSVRLQLSLVEELAGSLVSVTEPPSTPEQYLSERETVGALAEMLKQNRGEPAVMEAILSHLSMLRLDLLQVPEIREAASLAWKDAPEGSVTKELARDILLRTAFRAEPAPEPHLKGLIPVRDREEKKVETSEMGRGQQGSTRQPRSSVDTRRKPRGPKG